MYDRIVSDADVLSGKPCVKGTRISVEMILEWIASGASPADIAEAYSQLAEEDVQQAVRYAARFLENEVVTTAASAPA
ncbi:MAG: DUF433 domain-containing protein [Bacteroidetes bacterium QH_9_67_14]|nr:MAG: DUF433 domain-containing protein [Bacteroidetes bacterium QH_9_67_14]